jgi:hypothetical protein
MSIMKLEKRLQVFARISNVKFVGNHSERSADCEAVTDILFNFLEMRKKQGRKIFRTQSMFQSSLATFVGNNWFDKYLAGYTWNASKNARRFLCEILNDLNHWGLGTEDSLKFQNVKVHESWPWWPRSLRRGFAAVRLLGFGSDPP